MRANGDPESWTEGTIFLDGKVVRSSLRKDQPSEWRYWTIVIAIDERTKGRIEDLMQNLPFNDFEKSRFNMNSKKSDNMSQVKLNRYYTEEFEQDYSRRPNESSEHSDGKDYPMVF